MVPLWILILICKYLKIYYLNKKWIKLVPPSTIIKHFPLVIFPTIIAHIKIRLENHIRVRIRYTLWEWWMWLLVLINIRIRERILNKTWRGVELKLIFPIIFYLLLLQFNRVIKRSYGKGPRAAIEIDSPKVFFMGSYLELSLA